MPNPIKRAADLIRGKNRVPTMKEILTGGKLGSIRTPPAGEGRQASAELQAAQARGDTPTRDYTKPYTMRETPAQVRARQEREQASSPLFLEAIRRRLAGEALSNRPTMGEVDQAKRLHDLAEQMRLQQSALARRREKIRQELEGKVGQVKKQILKLKGAGLGFAEAAVEKAKDALAALSGDRLGRKLAGLGLGGSLPGLQEELPANEGFMKRTPGQRHPMNSVSSSNVASVGWEPNDPDAVIVDETVGTLFIVFRNSWQYRYKDMPHWVFEGLLRAPSKGRYVWTVLRRGLAPDSRPYGSWAAGDAYERIR